MSGFYLEPTGLQTGFLKERGMGRPMKNKASMKPGHLDASLACEETVLIFSLTQLC